MNLDYKSTYLYFSLFHASNVKKPVKKNHQVYEGRNNFIEVTKKFILQFHKRK
jgi:hypothetical protein